MDKKEAIEKLKEAGLEDVITALAGDDNGDRLAALEAKLQDAEGKASGILGDKKKYQKQVEDLQAKIDELEGKDLGEIEKLQRELERKDSLANKLAEEKAEIEKSWQTDKRNASLGKIAGELKWLDSVPPKTRDMIVSSEFGDVDDLGNEVVVKERLKTLSDTYSGLLASDAPSGAGSRAGDAPSGAKTVDMSLKDIAKDPLAYVTAMAEAAE